jgi:metal-dependent amidase/aminoacylase/carboxypeptidase family protein
LEDQGFNVTKRAYNLPTAFRAEYTQGQGRAVSFNAEYDALPGIGNACGHNLIATSSVAAGVEVKKVLERGELGGTSSHAALSPWLGRNALDAYMSAYSMVGVFRQAEHCGRKEPRLDGPGSPEKRNAS